MNEYVTLTITQRRARKAHCCDACGEAILQGNEYISLRGQRGGRYFYKKMHIHCDAAIDAYSNDTGCEPDRSQLDKVAKWLRASACPGCQDACQCTRIGGDLFGCQRILRRVLSPTVLPAALRSAQKNGAAPARGEMR